MKVYLDNCCLQRALDDKSQLKITLEAEIVLSLLTLFENGEIELMSSDVLIYETLKNTNIFRREYCLDILNQCNISVSLNEEIEDKAKIFNKYGVKPLDSLHLASAEWGGADYFCTSDEAFLKKAKKIATKTKPVSLLELIKEIEK
jgi:predicted nucleic acid-binding protein